MYLLYRLSRPVVLPVDDPGIGAGMRRHRVHLAPRQRRASEEIQL